MARKELRDTTRPWMRDELMYEAQKYTFPKSHLDLGKNNLAPYLSKVKGLKVELKWGPLRSRWIHEQSLSIVYSKLPCEVLPFVIKITSSTHAKA